MTQEEEQVQIEVHPPETLLKFEAPVFVGVSQTTGNNDNNKQTVSPQDNLKNQNSKSGSQLEDMMNSMIPPREWIEESGSWMQYVSKDAATRYDVISLQENLDQKLAERQARETGICQVREHLYQQAFDELIRQITLDGPERGLLALRIRDEIRMTIDAYKTLYNSSITFGVRKQLQSENGITELEDSIKELELEKSTLQTKVNELRNKVEVIDKRNNERRALEDKKRKEELDFLRVQQTHLEQFLKQVGGNSK